MNLKNIKVSSRLKKCAEMISPDSKIADIGTDHAYLPIWLAVQNKISYALACDLNQSPLENAINNIKKYNLEKIIEPRLSGGLENIKQHEADEIIIAGMGGELISSILENCTWDNKESKKFILQPMAYDHKLRKYLAQKGYKIENEEAVISAGKVYTVIKSVYTGKSYTINSTEKYIGKIQENLNSAAFTYITKQVKYLQNKQKGLLIKGCSSEEKQCRSAVSYLQKLIK